MLIMHCDLYEIHREKNTRIQIAECVELNPGFTAYSCPQSASNVLRNGYYVGGSSQPTAHFKDHYVLSVQNPARNSQGLKPRNTFPYWQGMIGIFKKAGHSLNTWSDVFKMAHKWSKWGRNAEWTLPSRSQNDYNHIFWPADRTVSKLPRAFCSKGIYWCEHLIWAFLVEISNCFKVLFPALDSVIPLPL